MPWEPKGKKVQAVNKPRMKQRREEAFGDCARMSRLLPCLVCDRPPPSDPAHVRARGAGGKDAGNVVPLCRKHHQFMSGVNGGIKALEKRFQVSLEVAASAVLDAVRSHACANWVRDGRCQVCRSEVAA
jgi:hypothetical protein